MHETFTVTVTTEDGELLAQKKTTGNYADLSFLFSRLSHVYLHLLEDSEKSETSHGSGICQPASDF